MRKLTDLFSLAAILGIPVLLAAFTLPMLAAPQAAQAAADPPGKVVFMAQKCEMCHSIDSQQIARTTKSEKMAGPDLSNVGGAHLAPWISQYLKKEVANSEGKKHGKDWKGTDEELKQLADWLATLKK
jgi:mono/diheme cytochrome c family protein